jgi:hypothetical protein
LLDELFLARARPIGVRRAELLSKVRRENGRPVLEDVLRAFLQPALEVCADDSAAAFVRLRAWITFQPAHFRQNLLGQAFDESTQTFIEILSEALPEVPKNDLGWRFHFMLGAMVYTMISPRPLGSPQQGTLGASEAAEALDELVRFSAAGLRVACGPRKPRARRATKT